MPERKTEKVAAVTYHHCKWRRQRSKGARWFRGQKILQPIH